MSTHIHGHGVKHLHACSAENSFLHSLSARGLFGMRAFFLPSRGDVNAPARSVEQPAASHVPSSLEQPADPFTSINALTVWLKAQGDESSSPELRRLRAAVAVLAQKANPNKEDVRPLCSAWGVQQCERKKNRPLATLIAELRQAVLAEGTRLRARGLAAQRGVIASSEI